MTQVYHAKLEEVQRNIKEAAQVTGPTVPIGLFNRLVSDLAFVVNLSTTQEVELEHLSSTLGQLRTQLNKIKELLA